MRKRSRILFVIAYILLPLSQLLPATSVGAISNFTYNTKVLYRISDDATTTVTEDYAITNNTPRQYLTQLKLSTPVATLSGLKVSYDDGAAIAASTTTKTTTKGDLAYDYQEIDMTFPRQNYGQGRSWRFRVTYNATGLTDSRGGGHTVYVPSIESGDTGDQYQATVDVPVGFGTAHFPGAKSASATVSGDRQYYNFDKASLIEHSLALAFGDRTVYSLHFNFPLVNDQALERVMTVTLPPDLNNQHSYLNSLTPAPTGTHLDADGNVLADYHVPAHGTVVVSTGVQTEVKYLEYDLKASRKKTDIPSDLVDLYTKSSKYWQTSGPVADQAKSLVHDDQPVIDNVHSIYQFVISKLSYNKNKIKFNIRQGAQAALSNPTNVVCLEYADLMIAMLRSQGIPARMPIGYAYSGSLKNTDSVADSLHAWVEAYIPGIGWMTLDPTWGEKFDTFGKSDLDHVAFAVWGSADQAPGAVMRGSVDTGYQYEATTLGYQTSVDPAKGAPSVALTRHVVLPFLAIDQIRVQAVPQIASDGNQASYGGMVVALGSLAPGQLLSVYRPRFGWGFWQLGRVVLSSVTGSVVSPLAEANGRLDWLPMFVILGLLATMLLIWTVLRLRARRQQVAVQPEVPQPPEESQPIHE
jgi:transglutaminase-like putative cysteine protease